MSREAARVQVPGTSASGVGSSGVSSRGGPKGAARPGGRWKGGVKRAGKGKVGSRSGGQQSVSAGQPSGSVSMGSGLSQLRTMSNDASSKCENLLRRPPKSGGLPPKEAHNPSSIRLAFWRNSQRRREGRMAHKAPPKVSPNAKGGPNQSMTDTPASDPASIRGGYNDKILVVEKDVAELQRVSNAAIQVLLDRDSQRLLMMGYPEMRTRNRALKILKVVETYLAQMEHPTELNYIQRVGEGEYELGHLHSAFINDAAELAINELWDLVHITVPQYKAVVSEMEKRRLEFEYAAFRIAHAKSFSEMDKLKEYYRQLKIHNATQDDFEAQEEKIRNVFQRLLLLEAKYHLHCTWTLSRIIKQMISELDRTAFVSGLSFVHTLTGFVHQADQQPDANHPPPNPSPDTNPSPSAISNPTQQSQGPTK